MSGRRLPSWVPRRRRGISGLRVSAAIAALIIVSAFVVRLSVSITSASPERQRTRVIEQAVVLEPDREGPLFPGAVLGPGDVVAACLAIENTGRGTVEELRLFAPTMTGSSDLAAHLQVQVDHGALAANGGDCSTFVAAGRVVDDSVALLVSQHGDEAGGLVLPVGERSAFRVSVRLDPDSPDQLQGHETGLDLAWAARGGERVTLTAAENVAILAASVAENSIVPLIVLIAVAVLFMGIQSRIDRRDPKLARAPSMSRSYDFG